MNLKEWLQNNGVETNTNNYPDEYKNVEKVVEKEVWICDYRCNDQIFNKPIRNIAPKLVKVLDIKDAKKRIYYSPVFFKEIKNGKLLSAEIAPYDNTGYRSYPGVSVNIFETRQECIEFYKEQVKIAIEKIKVEFESISDKFDSKTNELNKELKKYNQ